MSNVPKLLNISTWRVQISQDFIEFNDIKNWSPERQVEVFRNMIRKYIYKNSPLSEERITKALQAFTNAYELAKYKFQDIERNTGGRYFDHLVRVMQYVIQHTNEHSIKKTLIAICHDLIEDTDVDFSTLKSIFGTHIALGTLLISKEPIKKFIKQEDIQKFHQIERVWILNQKWLPSDEYLQKKSYSPEHITPEELEAEQMYESLEEKYKDVRNAKYFSHMMSDGSYECEEKIDENTPCINKFYNHALSLLASPNLSLKVDKQTVQQIVFDALEVKFWDRIDNLRTTEIYDDFNEKNIKKAQRKMQETKDFFYHISKEFDTLKGTQFYKLIKTEILKMERYIIQKRVEVTL